MKDLTISNIERQNVLNNRFAVSKVQEHLDIEGMLFEIGRASCRERV